VDESVCVNKIVDQKLEIDLKGVVYQSGDISMEVGCQKDLIDLDSNGDGVLDVGDLTSKSAFLPKGPFSCVIEALAAKAFVESGLIAERQEEVVKHFFKLYNRLGTINDIVVTGYEDAVTETSVPGWSQAHSDTWGRELEFSDAGYWMDYVKPHVTRRGILTNYYDYGMSADYSYRVFMHTREKVTGRGLGYQLIEELRMVLEDLCGITNVKNKDRWSEPSYFYEINSDLAPKIIRGKLKEAIGWYNSAAGFLMNYREVECDGPECLSDDEFELQNFTLIKDIAEIA